MRKKKCCLLPKKMKESERKSGLGSKIEGEMDKWGIKKVEKLWEKWNWNFVGLEFRKSLLMWGKLFFCSTCINNFIINNIVYGWRRGFDYWLLVLGEQETLTMLAGSRLCRLTYQTPFQPRHSFIYIVAFVHIKLSLPLLRLWPLKTIDSVAE